MLRSLGVGAAAALVTTKQQPAVGLPHPAFQQVVDLTHTLTPDFPSPWKEPLVLEQISKLGKDKWNIYRWHLNEHIGTHLDAPLHCSELRSADQIPPQELVAPLVVIDIRARVAANPDSQLTPDDLKRWEARHGSVPEGAVVALFSGWDAFVNNARKFLGLDERGEYHLPGFHLESVQFLHEQRSAVAIGTDTLNLDAAGAADFPVHHYWLGHNKWGLENLANLARVPVTGATIIVGCPKIAGCTGGPSRVLALV